MPFLFTSFRIMRLVEKDAILSYRLTGAAILFCGAIIMSGILIIIFGETTNVLVKWVGFLVNVSAGHSENTPIQMVGALISAIGMHFTIRFSAECGRFDFSARIFTLDFYKERVKFSDIHALELAPVGRGCRIYIVQKNGANIHVAYLPDAATARADAGKLAYFLRCDIRDKLEKGTDP